LDASLRSLEAVEVFRRDADALRNDLRALRALGFGGAPAESWTVDRYDVPRGGIPAAVLRLAAESVLIVAVAVIAGVAHLRPVAIVALMAAAFVIVAVSEWLAARARFVPPAIAFLPPVGEGEPAPYVEAPAPPWSVAGEPDEDTEPEALTVVEILAEQNVDPWETGLETNGDEPAPEAEPELAER